jgi:hypothetical protein
VEGEMGVRCLGIVVAVSARSFVSGADGVSNATEPAVQPADRGSQDGTDAGGETAGSGVGAEAGGGAMSDPATCLPPT